MKKGKADIKVEVDSSEVEKKISELTGDLQRTRADFENYRKQVEAQKLAEKKMAELATVYKVLPLVDDIDRAIVNYAELVPLKKSLEKTLKELGLVRISSEAEVEFNPDLHEAVMVEGDGEKEVIAETLRPGYYYNGEVLRPAMVKVKKI
jgi:molecular chaperone GrpE